MPQKFDKDIADERGYRGNYKILCGKNILDSPKQASALAQAGMREFSHQKIGIKQEGYKTHLDHGSPDIFHHGKQNSCACGNRRLASATFRGHLLTRKEAVVPYKIRKKDRPSIEKGHVLTIPGNYFGDKLPDFHILRRIISLALETSWQTNRSRQPCLCAAL
jgi:hypothetical protein